MLECFFDGNSFTTYLEASLRYLFLRYVQRKDVQFKRLLQGKKAVKANDLYNFDNEVANKSWGCGFYLLVVIVLGVLSAWGVL